MRGLTVHKFYFQGKSGILGTLVARFHPFTCPVFPGLWLSLQAQRVLDKAENETAFQQLLAMFSLGICAQQKLLQVY